MDERASRRVVVDLQVGAKVNGRLLRLLAYDLSMDGCMVDTCGEPLPAAGNAITIQLADALEIAGTLVWTLGRFGGVQFAQRLKHNLVEELGFKPKSEMTVTFKDRFGRSLTLPGERFRL
jgi:hypothetical protein